MSHVHHHPKLTAISFPATSHDHGNEFSSIAKVTVNDHVATAGTHVRFDTIGAVISHWFVLYLVVIPSYHDCNVGDIYAVLSALRSKLLFCILKLFTVLKLLKLSGIVHVNSLSIKYILLILVKDHILVGNSPVISLPRKYIYTTSDIFQMFSGSGPVRLLLLRYKYVGHGVLPNVDGSGHVRLLLCKLR